MSTNSSINDNVMSAKQWQNENKNQETDYFHFSKIMFNHCIKYHRMRNLFFAVFSGIGLNKDILGHFLCESLFSFRIWEKMKIKKQRIQIFFTKYQTFSNLSLESSVRSSYPFCYHWIIFKLYNLKQVRPVY